MTESPPKRAATAAESSDSPPPQTRHFTREPWWVVPLAGVVAALLPLIKYGRFQRALPGTSLLIGMATAGAFGVVASAILVARSRVRSPFRANVVLWAGILIATLGVCVLSILMQD